MKNKNVNIIKVDHDKITSEIKIDEIILSKDSKNSQKLHIDILQNCTLVLETNDVARFSLSLNVKPGIKTSFLFLKKGINGFYEEHYSLGKDSFLTLNKICLMKGNEEKVNVSMDGQRAKMHYVCKTISEDKEKYSVNIHHLAEDTECIFYNHGINHKNGCLSFQVANIVPKRVLHAKIDQNSRIITFNNQKCEIKPELFIAENEVEASHSAHIGTFPFDTLFYFQSRGIKREKAFNLLLKGYITQKLFFKDERLTKIIDKYWR